MGGSFGKPELCWTSQQASSQNDTAFSFPCVTANQMSATNTANSNITFFICRINWLVHNTRMSSIKTVSWK